ncbi:thiamine pyrophosphate-binding protein [Pseudomonas aeruginosa]
MLHATTKTLTAGQALVRLLANYGVDTVSGIPGVHTLELYRGLPGSGIRHVLTRHEQGAGFMADGYARVSGKPGVCFVITGPGVTNVATAIGQAYADSVPPLVISSVNHSASLGKGWGCLHETQDQRASDRADHCLLRPGLEPGTAARTDRPGLRGVRQRASAPGAYLDPARRARRAGGP